MTSIFNKLLTAPQIKCQGGALNNGREIDTPRDFHRTKAKEILPAHPHQWVFSTPSSSLWALLSLRAPSAGSIQHVSKLLCHLCSVRPCWDLLSFSHSSNVYLVPNRLGGFVWLSCSWSSVVQGMRPVILRSKRHESLRCAAAQSWLNADACGKVMILTEKVGSD